MAVIKLPLEGHQVGFLWITLHGRQVKRRSSREGLISVSKRITYVNINSAGLISKSKPFFNSTS